MLMHMGVACGQEFTCEICGGQSYWGRRAFERHFKEWRHQNGMRALGIPNTKTFFEVTQMKDALELWNSIKVSVHFILTQMLLEMFVAGPLCMNNPGGAMCTVLAVL